jgi:hypothetical protein
MSINYPAKNYIIPVKTLIINWLAHLLSKPVQVENVTETSYR